VNVDGSLVSWDLVSNRIDLAEAGILLGNGASMAIAPTLSYPALFNVSCDENDSNHLGVMERRVFDEFGTRNFEEVLYNLRVAQRTCSCFGFQEEELVSLDGRYENIRNSLISAVRRVHPQPGELAEDIKERVSSHLALYKNLFTTNYDLIVFWSIAAKQYVFPDGSGREKTKQFKDFFWNREGIFDPADTDVWSGTIGVHFLHGGLHLYRNRITGATHKHRTLSEPPLSYFENDDNLLPLFVSEGENQSKVRAIRSNEYLSFVFSRFIRHDGDLIVFGQSLNAQFDGHIVEAIARWPGMDRRRLRNRRPPKKRTIAISIRPNNGREHVRLEKLRILGLFKTDEVDVLFFNANSQPISSGA
jgi:Domain of unknown function (DUF4917)